MRTLGNKSLLFAAPCWMEPDDVLSALLPSFFLAVPLFWVMEKLLRRLGCYKFVWHANLVRVALFIITYSILFGLAYE